MQRHLGQRGSGLRGRGPFAALALAATVATLLSPHGSAAAQADAAPPAAARPDASRPVPADPPPARPPPAPPPPAAAPTAPTPPAPPPFGPPQGAAPSRSAPAESAPPAHAEPHEPPSAGVEPLEPGHAAPLPEVPVLLKERRVFSLRVPRGSLTAEERAREASKILERAAQEQGLPEVRVDDRPGVSVVYVGSSPLVQLSRDDAEAEGDVSLSAHAAGVAAAVRDALAKENSRSRLANGVFNFSVLIFSGLIALLLLRKVAELVDRVRGWIAQHPERLPVLRVRGIEVLRPAAFQGAISVSLGIARVFAQIGIAYAWVLLALSRFESTAGYSERLSGFVLAPVSELMTRVARSLPVLVLAGIAVLAVVILLRFVGLFFGSVGRGETSLGWLPSDLAVATGVIVRFGILVASLVLGAPLVTGEEDGAISRAGAVVLAAMGLAITPLLASAVAGAAVIYGRRLRVGDVADIGGRYGRVRELTLLEVRLEDDEGCVVRVPHLLSLIRPTRVSGRHHVISIDVSVAPDADLEQARDVILASGAGIGTRVRAALMALDDGGAHFHATASAEGRDARTRWLLAIAARLAAAGIPLGRARAARAQGEPPPRAAPAAGGSEPP